MDAILAATKAAKLLGINPRVLTKLAREGKIPCQYTPGGHRRYKKSEIERIAREGKRRNEGNERQD